jgi:hypothetical protein
MKLKNNNIKTIEFRNYFPTDTDFFDFLDSRRADINLSEDSFVQQLRDTVERCLQCGGYNPMTDFIQIVYVEMSPTSALDDNFWGCPFCFLRQLDKYPNKVGRISL